MAKVTVKKKEIPHLERLYKLVSEKQTMHGEPIVKDGKTIKGAKLTLSEASPGVPILKRIIKDAKKGEK